MMDSIPDILSDLAQGKMVVLVDDENRENEGDLICAASFATPDTVNFMLREGRGMLFVALDGETCDRLALPPQTAVNTTQRGTAYTISVDASARYGVTTGVSASDRATTIQRLSDPTAKPSDFDRPGHIHPLRARDGGVLVRAGHTEGMTDLCRMAGLSPTAFGIEIMKPDGTMARLSDLIPFCREKGIRIASIADVIEYRLRDQKLVHRLEESTIRTPAGEFRLIAYASAVDDWPHVALVLGEVGKRDAIGRPLAMDRSVLVRMHSQNLLGDVFGDCTQPSGDALKQSMRMIQAEGSGAIVYLRHQGMGSGLLKRLQSPVVEGEHSQRSVQLGLSHRWPGMAPPADKRDYGIGSQILRDLGIRRLKLITNHPFMPTALEGFGLSIDGFVAMASG